MNYPKVCFECNRPHIRSNDDEVISMDGKKSYHKDCQATEKVDLVQTETAELETEELETEDTAK